jgi:hypothetical protein
MLDKEKQKIKKAREAAGEDVGADVTSPKVCPQWLRYARLDFADPSCRSARLLTSTAARPGRVARTRPLLTRATTTKRRRSRGRRARPPRRRRSPRLRSTSIPMRRSRMRTSRKRSRR